MWYYLDDILLTLVILDWMKNHTKTIWLMAFGAKLWLMQYLSVLCSIKFIRQKMGLLDIMMGLYKWWELNIYSYLALKNTISLTIGLSGTAYVFSYNFRKIKIDSDDDLPQKRTLTYVIL